jgi:hypothetical protein
MNLIRLVVASFAASFAATALAQVAQLDLKGILPYSKGQLDTSICVKNVAYPDPTAAPSISVLPDPDWTPFPAYSNPNAASFGKICLKPRGAPKGVEAKVVGARLDMFKLNGKVMFRWHFTSSKFRWRPEGAPEMVDAALVADVVVGPFAPKMSFEIFSVADGTTVYAKSSDGGVDPWLPFYGTIMMKGSSGHEQK